MRKVHIHYESLREPLIRYSSEDKEFFRHESTLYQTFGEYPDYGEDSNGSIFSAYENGEFLTYPIDEDGEVRDAIYDCKHIGRRGDRVSCFHKSIMCSCVTGSPKMIPDIVKKIKRKLKGYGIRIHFKKENCLNMTLYCNVSESNQRYYFSSGGYWSDSLPFTHDYDADKYSDEALGKDIADTLKNLFRVFPSPKCLVLNVHNIVGSGHNKNVIRILNDSGEFRFKLSARGKTTIHKSCNQSSQP